MPKNLGLYNNDLSVPRKKDVDALETLVDAHEGDIDTLTNRVDSLETGLGDVNTSLSSKQNKINGAASTVTDNNLTVSRALISNISGKIAVSAVTDTELGYLSGVTSNVQTQLNSKLSTAPVTSVNAKTGAVSLTASDVDALPINGGTMTGVINMGGYRITNVATPTASTDAANKAYADSQKGVEVLTQSAQPTAQVNGDMWFQTT